MNNLISLIERKRAEMYAAADKYGISSEKTIAISRKLDKLVTVEQIRRLRVKE